MVDLLIRSLETNDEDCWLFTSLSEIPKIPQDSVFAQYPAYTKIKGVGYLKLIVGEYGCLHCTTKFIVYANLFFSLHLFRQHTAAIVFLT